MNARGASIGVASLCALLSAQVGCKKATQDGVGMAAGSAPVLPKAPPKARAEANSAQAPPWFLGEFSGQYQAKLATVDVKAGGAREWKSDDGKLASGPGTLTLRIDRDGHVDGVAVGALGASSATGKVEDDTLLVQLLPTDATGLRGVLVASRTGDGFKGSIQASSTDSLRVRQAVVELKKQVN